MLTSHNLSNLNPDQIIIPSLAEPNRDYKWRRGVNLGRVAANYLLSDGKVFSPPLVGMVHITSLESVARQAASSEANASTNETYQMNQNTLEILQRHGYKGNGKFPGLVVGLNPSAYGHSSLNPNQYHNHQERSLSMIPMADIDAASQKFLHNLLND